MGGIGREMNEDEGLKGEGLKAVRVNVRGKIRWR